MVAIIAIISSSCSPSMKSPAELIQRPKLNINEKIARDVIYENIPNSAKLIRPLNTGKLSSVGFFSFKDKSNNNEAFAFYKNPKNQTVGFLILSKNNNNEFETFSKEEIIGSDISYANFIDLNNDGYKELIFGIDNKGSVFKNVKIYLWTKNGYILSGEEAYTELIIEDLDKDKSKEIFCLIHDRNTIAAARVFRIVENKVKLIDEIPLDQDISAYYNVQYGRTSGTDYGVFIDFNIGFKSATNILFYKDDKLELAENPFIENQNYKNTVKSKRVNSYDIDKDGNIEIASLYNPLYSNIDTNNTSVYAWYNYYREKHKYKLKTITYSGKNEEYEIIFPKKWISNMLKGSLTVITSSLKQNKDYLKLYYISEDNNLSWLLTYESLNTDKFNKWKENPENKKFKYKVLDTKNNKTLFLYHLKEFSNIDSNYSKQYNSLLLDEKSLNTSARYIK